MKTWFFLFIPLALLWAQSIPTNVRVSVYGPYHPEVTIAINPTNPQNLLVSSNGLQVYYSYDGGQTWGQHFQTSIYGNCGDACVLFDTYGYAYLATLAYHPDSGFELERIVIHRSDDGGNTYPLLSFAGYDTCSYQDKEWLGTDLTDSPFRGNLYVCWTRFDTLYSSSENDSSRIMFSFSTDTGRTWSPAMRISDRQGDCLDGDNTMEGAVPAVGPNGEIYVSWAGLSKIWFDQSTDGGHTFGKDKIIAEQPGGWKFDVSGLMRCNGLPQTLCDTSRISPFRGTIYVVFSDQRNGEDNTDVFLIKSTDQGQTWSAPVKVNQDTGRAQQFYPWAAIDPASGYLYVVFYDRREHPNSDTTDVYLARSVDGGETFTDFRINQDSFKPRSDVFFGDYINMTAFAGHIYPIWVKMVGSSTSIWMAPISEPVGIDQRQPSLVSEFRILQNYPNPFNARTTVIYSLAEKQNVRFTLFNILGQKIKNWQLPAQMPGKHKLVLDFSDFSAGVYFLKMQSGNRISGRKMVYIP